MKTMISFFLALIMMLACFPVIAEDAGDVTEAAAEAFVIDPEAPEYMIGDTVSTDVAEFTLTGFGYVYHLEPTSFAEKDTDKGGAIEPGEGMIFANPEYTVNNIGEETIAAGADVTFTVVYGEDVLFVMGGETVCYIVDGPFKGGEYTADSCVYLELAPLTQEAYEAYIPADALIETDEETQLRLVVSVKSSEGTEQFVYRIR